MQEYYCDVRASTFYNMHINLMPSSGRSRILGYDAVRLLANDRVSNAFGLLPHMPIGQSMYSPTCFFHASSTSFSE